ncbi:hypothetical protein HQ533_05915 [Candidatus Woesearchaeota archaeon]|nr:hypothetical protein [Candidatus Woesearchaeota archaeon]
MNAELVLNQPINADNLKQLFVLFAETHDAPTVDGHFEFLEKKGIDRLLSHNTVRLNSSPGVEFIVDLIQMPNEQEKIATTEEYKLSIFGCNDHLSGGKPDELEAKIRAYLKQEGIDYKEVN